MFRGGGPDRVRVLILVCEPDHQILRSGARQTRAHLSRDDGVDQLDREVAPGTRCVRVGGRGAEANEQGFTSRRRQCLFDKTRGEFAMCGPASGRSHIRRGGEMFVAGCWERECDCPLSALV